MKKKILILVGFLFYSICLIKASLHINSENCAKTYNHCTLQKSEAAGSPEANKTAGNNIAYKSTKNAFVAGKPYNGTFNKPDTLLYGDELTYEIKVVNPNNLNSLVTINDTIPEGLTIPAGSISNNGYYDTFTRIITWKLQIPPGDSTQISYKAKKITGTANRMVNTAYIMNDENIQPTNSTFHQGALAKVTFSAGKNGSISKASPQFIDYGFYPYYGIGIIPDPGFRFIGWSYPAYTGLNGDYYPKTSGISEYDKVNIYGNIHFTANFEMINYYIDYDLQEGNMGTINNPNSYTITSDDIILNEPAKTGCIFMGWTGSNGPTPQRKITIPKGSTGDKIYIANWMETKDTENIFYISYDYKGGTAPKTENSVFYKKIASDILLNPPSRSGYTFAGWTIISDAGEIIGNKIPGGTQGNLTCKANWTLNTYPISFTDNGKNITIKPNKYTVNDLPFTINEIPDKPGYKFVGWTGSNGQIPEQSIRVPKETSGALTYQANWAFQFDEDTLYCCQLPVSLESGHNGLDYEWILPDGRSIYSENLQAEVSGRYVLRTNYGSMVIADTIVVLAFFENDLTINDISKTGNKIGKEQIYTVKLNQLLKNVNYHWKFEGASPSTHTGDTAKVIYHSTGRRKIKVKITVEHNQQSCSKELTCDTDIFPANRGFFVNQHASSGGLKDGSSWINAFYTLQDALEKATEGDYIWVAKGDYIPEKNTSFFVKHNKVEIYGGFNGTETFLYERNLSKNPTYLNGNGCSVITNSNVSEIHWDGFIINEGMATQGGGFFMNKADVTIANCIIRNNEAVEGGGIYTINSSPTLYNVEISGNKAEKGGAIYNKKANPVITNATISGNQAETGGGLFNINSTKPLIENTIIYGNRAKISPNMYNEKTNPYISYSLIEGSNGSGTDWNSTFGTDKSRNLDKNPMFKKAGFDKKGNMQTGDYELYSSSEPVDKGNSACIFKMQIRADQDLSSPTESIQTSLLYDLKGNKRIIADYTDIGAYEYETPDIDWNMEIPVVIPEAGGFITDPAEGEHMVKKNKDFTFSIIAKPGYNMDNLTVKTGKPAWDEKGGIKIEKKDDGSVKVTILAITSRTNITISGVSPVSNDVIGNQNVWAYKNKLYVKAEKETSLKIYTFTGQLHSLVNISNGENMINLDPGIYTVVLGDKNYKISISANH